MDEHANIHTSGENKPFQERVDEIRNLLEENLRYTKVIHEFTPKDALEREKEFQKILKDNFEYTKACYAVLEKIRRWIFFQNIFFIIKFIAIVIPIILAVIYLPPIFKNALSQYLDLLGAADALK